MEHATPRHAALESFRPYSHSEPLAKAIELLLIKLPDPRTPARAPRKPLPQRVRKLLASEVTEMIDRYQQGGAVVELAKQYGIDRETVRRAVRSAGLGAHPRGLTAQQIGEAVRLYASGQSLARIGDRYDVTAGTVRRRLIERGVTMRPTNTPRGRS